ncbi:hypothetical protein [Kangiella shandongensis]|uniref:hypothetical protein n=1 Tax=Kangiella shandongensis TaxID=2763258 RepID=UPI001CBAA6FB|nr:hypothetical protein [Kangiella shandongensis]
MAQNRGAFPAQKAEYVLSEDGVNSLLTVWVSDGTIAFSPQGTDQIAAWHLWQTDNPTFYQIFPNVKYRIEFDRLTSHEMQSVLAQLKQLVKDESLVDDAEFSNKELTLSSLDSGEQAQNEIRSWNDFKTLDYADIGDNEADPVLGRLIQQGFVRGF